MLMQKITDIILILIILQANNFPDKFRIGTPTRHRAGFGGKNR